MTLTPHAFAVLLVFGSAVLALWTVVRFPKIGPSGVLGALIQIALAYLTTSALFQVIPLLTAAAPRPALGAAIVLGTLPPLVYFFMTIAWFVRSVQRLVSAYR